MFGLFPKKKIHISLPAQTRVIAIGDIHGQGHRLLSVMADVEKYRRRHPVRHEHIVFLGDFTDRGPKSPQVIEYLAKRHKRAQNAPHAEVFLQGNHEELVLDALDTRGTRQEVWWRNGGQQTVNSYLEFQKITAPDHLSIADKLALFRQSYPQHHKDFMDRLISKYQVGPLVFVHAGLQMDTALSEQKDEDMHWIRDPFLHWKGDPKDFLVVHGHSITPRMKPEIHPHRIAIDTGSYKFKGRITAAVFEENHVQFFSNGTRKGFIKTVFS